jgi:pimeloyl-ACP methyl ester carboxylesterase
MHARVATMAIGVFALRCARHASPEQSMDLRDAAPTSVAAPPPVAAPTSVVEADADHDTPGQPETLTGSSESYELLDDDRQKLGFVSVPLGAHEPRPIMIAIHGGSERPERACSAWRGASEAYPFVVCPRGWGGNESALGWRSVSDTTDRITRAIAATKKKFGPWVKDTPSIVLAGFSMGGSQVALLARRHPRTYRRIVVGDSAHDPRPALGFSPAWVKGGGERAVFLCTTSGCEPALRNAARNVAREKARARLNIASTQVHGLSEPVVQSMRRDWPWLVEGAEGWETYAPPREASLPGRTESFEPN